MIAAVCVSLLVLLAGGWFGFTLLHKEYPYIYRSGIEGDVILAALKRGRSRSQ